MNRPVTSWYDYVRMPYSLGVYLAVNAIPDAYLVVDGPDCLFFKAEFVHGTHDLHSTLLDAASRHRVIHTVADTNNVVVDRDAVVTDLLLRVASAPEVGAVLVTALPMTAITGSQYDRLARIAHAETGKPILEVAANSLRGDWLDGYAEVFASLASGLDLVPRERDPDGVALVGLLLDRTEADNLANILELKRLLEDGLGLKVVASWPSNQRIFRLAQAGTVSHVISFPYARKAARILAERTGASLTEAKVPFGLKATADLLRAVARVTGREERAETLIRAEEETCAPWLRLASERAIRGHRFGLVGDPYLAPRIAEFLEALGGMVAAYVSTRYPPPDVLPGVPGAEAMQRGRVDLCITTTLGLDILGRHHIPHSEFGFPSYGRHALSTTPFLGYRGAVWFAQWLAGEIGFQEDLRRFGLVPRDSNPFIGERGV